MPCATYRLSKDIASFEFFNWLVMVKAGGATEIVFDTANPKTNKFPLDVTMERFRSIIEPGPALAGLPSRHGSDASSLSATASQLLPWVKSGNVFERLITVKPVAECSCTVTIRDNSQAKARDSNRDAWERFAEEIGATVIDDYRIDPIHLHDRVALYAGAKMNFGVCNGPTHLITQTPYPVMMFVNTESARRNTIRWGSQPGENLPWMLSNQRLIWQEDSFDNLRRIFDEARL